MFFIQKPFHDLQRKYQETHSLFFTQSEQLFKRFEQIFKNKIEYFGDYENLKKSFDMIKHDLDPKAKEGVVKLEHFVKEHNTKSFTAYYEPVKINLDLYASTVKKLMDELQKFLQPEEAAKIAIAEVKELVRVLRAEYFAKQHQLHVLEPQFNTILEHLDNRMLEVESRLDTADYDDIAVSLKKMTKTTQKVIGLLDSLPRLVVLITRTIPDKMTTLKIDVETLTKQGYPLHNLLIKDTLNKISSDLDEFQSRLFQLKIIGIETALLAYSEKIDSFYPLFEVEKQAKVVVEAELESTYNLVNNLEKKFSKMNANLPQVKNVYVIEDSQLQAIEAIKIIISRLNVTKRGLDTLVLSGTKQPFSIQLNKIMQLKTDASEVEKMMESFTQYIASLKQQSQAAFQAVNQYYLKLKTTEKNLLDLHLPALEEPYLVTLSSYYGRLQSIVEALSQLPINMNIIQQNLKIMHDEAEAFMNQIDHNVNLASATESLLIKANKERHRTSDNQRIISLAEQAFFEGKFEKANQEASNLLKKIQSLKVNK
jgi:septation ring formation regulator EzrA